nr:unnamed protein product [Callosobruchus chinensis]
MAVLGFTLPPDSGEKLSLGKLIWIIYQSFNLTDSWSNPYCCRYNLN